MLLQQKILHIHVLQKNMDQPCNQGWQIINLFISIKILFFPPMLSIASFHLFLHTLFGLWLPQLGKPLHVAGTSAIWHQAHFFRLFDVANNLFTQRKDSYSIWFMNGAWVSDILSKHQSRALMRMYFIVRKKFLACTKSNPSPSEQIFMKQMFFLWA